MKYWTLLTTIILVTNIKFSNNYKYLTLYSEKVDSNKIYKLKVKLIKKEKIKSGCGVLAVALAQKFKILESDSTDLIGKDVILIEKCPELLGKDFFSRSEIYLIHASLKPLHQPDVLFNKYGSENHATFWSNRIQKITN